MRRVLADIAKTRVVRVSLSLPSPTRVSVTSRGTLVERPGPAFRSNSTSKMPKRKTTSPPPPTTPSPLKPGPRKLKAQAADGATVDGTFGDVVVADALRGLSTRDPKLGELINRHGTLPRIFACQDSRRATHEPNRAFRSLARAIVFQQLNGTAAATIFGRVLRCVGAEDDPAISLTPDAIIDADEAEMRACGLSQRKYEYLVSLASAFHPSHSDYPLTDESLEAMDDVEVMSSLVALRGVGPWSVHMFQMFYLNRPDVLPTKDFGVRKGVMRLYGLKDMPSEAKVEEIAESWKPHRTLASMYMWQAADEGKSSGQMQASTTKGKGKGEETTTDTWSGGTKKAKKR